MKRWLAIALLGGSAFAQVQLGRNVQIGAGGTGPTLDVQTNGVDNLSQTLLDLDQGTNMVITNTSGGHVLFDAAAASSQFQQQVIPPSAGQYVIVYPKNVVASGLARATAVTTPGSIGAKLSFTIGCGGLATCSGTFTWTGFTLPSYVIPANVTAIYPFTIYSGGSITSGNAVVSPAGSLGINSDIHSLMHQVTGSTGMTGAQVSGSSVQMNFQRTLVVAAGENPNINIASVGYIVYYTGTAPPTNTNIIVDPPLFFNGTSFDLGIDPMAIGNLQPLYIAGLPAASNASGYIYQVIDGASSSDCTTGGGSTVNLCRSNGSAWSIFTSGGGGGGLSGQTTGYVPLATSATASTVSSALQDTGSTLVYHGTGTQHGLSFGASSGGLITPLAGSAGIGTDASGLWNAYENGGTWSRLCTVGNGLCTGSVGVSSIDTQTGAFTFSGAGVSHVGNAYTFSGGGSAGAWSALTNPTANLSLSMGANLTSFSFPGVFVNTQMDQPFQFLGNGINVQTEFQVEQGGTKFATEAGSFGLAIPSTSTVYQSNALASYTNNASANTNAVAGYFSSRSLGGPIWGINPVYDDAGFGIIGYGDETDCNVANTANIGPCLFVTGLPVAGNNFAAVGVSSGNSNAWKYGYQTGDGKAITAINIGTATTSSSSNSQPIVLNATSGARYAQTLSAVPGGFVMQPSLNAFGVPALEVDTNNTTSTGQYAIKAVQNLTATTLNATILGLGYCPFQGWKDATPTEAFGLCYGIEGTLGGNNPTFGYYNGTSWASAWFVNSTTGKTNFQTGVVLPITGSTQCLHVDTSGNVTGTGSDCGAGSSAFSALTGGTNTTAAMLVGSGASLAPTGTGTIQATNIASTIAVSAPITVTGTGSTASPYTIACPTCGTSTGGTSVSQNSGAAEVNLPITGYMPQVCSDVSASGTAQSCTVANSFTPQAGNCLVYKTTTANSGTGLTVNINSLGAKSVAVPGSSGWTTTLVASSSIPANKPMNLCYDGTNWNASGTGFAATPSAPVVRSSNLQASNASSYTVTWPTGTVAGDSVFIFYGGGNQLSAVPSGWTQLDPLVSNPQWTGEIIYKVMTSGDITTGNVILTPTSAFDSVVGAVTITGKAIAFRDFVSQKNSTGGTSWTVTTGLTPGAIDLAIYFGSSRANCTATVSLGTLLQQANDGSAGCGAIYAGSPASFGALSPAFNYTAAGTGSYNGVVVLRSTP